MRQCTVLIGDDHSLIRKGVRDLLSDAFEVVGVAENGRIVVEMAARLRPQIVLLDVSMPMLNGIDAGQQIRSLHPETRLIFLSMHSNAIYLRKAIEVGASAYVLKSGATEELLQAFQVVRRGGTYWSPGLDSSLLEYAREGGHTHWRQMVEMTGRQREILQLIAEGRQNKEIAAVLGVSVKTVEFHRARLIHKLGARTVAELTRIALQEGLISPGS